MKLNHLSLPVRDVNEAEALLLTHFGFHEVARQEDEIVMLSDGEGFTLVLSVIDGREGADIDYPGDVHLGFWLGDRAEVDRIHTQLAEAGYAPEGTQEMRNRYGFYFTAVGTLRFEVSSER